MTAPADAIFRGDHTVVSTGNLLLFRTYRQLDIDTVPGTILVQKIERISYCTGGGRTVRKL